MAYQTVRTQTRDAASIITLNRPAALNALSTELCAELVDALRIADADPAVRAIIITGSEKAFAAGADIAEMRGHDYVSARRSNFLGLWDEVTQVGKPLIAAVSGYALGGGAELSYLCDIIVADRSAKFGQPEITLGIIPGIGGTQRLSRAVGKAKAMDMVLTGRLMNAAEAEAAGLVSRLVDEGKALEEALQIAARLAALPELALQSAKKAVLASFDMPLAQGLAYERELFYALFATQDQTEGMSAFLEKRTPKFSGA